MSRTSSPLDALPVLDLASDSELVARCVAGRSDALVELYDRYGERCFQLACALVDDRRQAEAVVRESFLALWEEPHGPEATGRTVHGWLRRQTYDRAAALAGTSGSAPAVPHLERSAPLAHLRAPQRRLVVLAYWGGWTLPEIAALDKTQLRTVKARARAAVASFAGAPAGFARARPLR